MIHLGEMWNVSEMSEPIDLGAIYDFFTNDAGGARFQASVIAQVFYFPIYVFINLI